MLLLWHPKCDVPCVSDFSLFCSAKGRKKFLRRKHRGIAPPPLDWVSVPPLVVRRNTFLSSNSLQKQVSRPVPGCCSACFCFPFELSSNSLASKIPSFVGALCIIKDAPKPCHRFVDELQQFCGGGGVVPQLRHKR